MNLKSHQVSILTFRGIEIDVKALASIIIFNIIITLSGMVAHFGESGGLKYILWTLQRERRAR